MKPADGPEKPSKVEIAKGNSHQLRGTIAEVLTGDPPRFEHDDVQLLKFHGIYQQYDRDQRKTQGAGASERTYQFLTRLRIPGGLLTAHQYIAIDRIADELTVGSLRITSRQGIQFHGILKSDLKAVIHRVNKALLTTRGACGDVCRNVMCCPAPATTPSHVTLAAFAQDIADEMAPRSNAYAEIWLDGEKVAASPDEEPFYGKLYLPRKFKVGIAMPGDNCVDLYTQDVGLMPIIDNGQVRGVNIFVGGGLGLTHGKADTFARLASPFGFVEKDRVMDAIRTIAAIFRDHGNRSNRRHARLKYLIEEWGLDRFKETFEKQIGFTLAPLIEDGPLDCDDHLGPHQQLNGQWFYGLFVENGRIHDVDRLPLRSALQTVVTELQPNLALTPQQNILFTDLEEKQIERLLGILKDHGVARSEDISLARRFSMACPALPTCGLAISEAERVMPTIIDAFERELASLGLSDRRLSIRATGCPNGCSRPYTADIGIVGRKANSYDVYVGGRMAGDRMVDLHAESVPLDKLIETLHPLLKNFKDKSRAGETFGDFYDRACRTGSPRQILTGEKLL